jgi:hypothetical protein
MLYMSRGAVAIVVSNVLDGHLALAGKSHKTKVARMKPSAMRGAVAAYPGFR